jgi:hypothetical protein
LKDVKPDDYPDAQTFLEWRSTFVQKRGHLMKVMDSLGMLMSWKGSKVWGLAFD